METAISRNTAELERLEGIIARNLQSFYEVGRALMAIRDGQLYRDVLGFDTFEAYCKSKWDFSRRYAYLLMDSATVVENVNHGSQIPAPVNERQARPLARLQPAQQREAWSAAVRTAPEGKITAAHVYKIVRDMTNPEPPPKEEPSKDETPSDALFFAGIAISQLERIHPKDPKREEALRNVENWISKHRKGGK